MHTLFYTKMRIDEVRVQKRSLQGMCCKEHAVKKSLRGSYSVIVRACFVSTEKKGR